MTGKEYQELAMRTSAFKTNDHGTILQDELIHAVCGLASEAGECTGLVQKIYQGHELDKDHLKKELGDALWFIAEACDYLGCIMDDIMQMNIDKLKARYPQGFEAERSLHRVEGDI